MKKILFSAFAILLASCSSTVVAKWDAAAASKTCFDAASKGEYDLDDTQLKRLHGTFD